MRFQTAALIASLATGAVSASSAAHVKHMQMHAARDAKVDYSKVDYSGVNWAGMDWSSILGGKNGAAPTPASSSAPASTPVVQAVQNNVAPSSSTPQSSSAPAAAPSGKSDPLSSLTNGVSGAIGDVAAVMSKLSKTAAGLIIADAASDGTCKEGSDGPYVVNAKNNKNTPMLLTVWNSNTGYQSSFVGKGVVKPVGKFVIGPGQTTPISFKSGSSGAMAPSWEDSAPTQNGQISNTWLEFTFSPTGVIDVSREVDMGGDPISAVVKSNGCKSNMDTCSFQCTDGSQSCMTNYRLMNCAGQPGAQPGDRDGGCGWNGATKETIDAVFG